MTKEIDCKTEILKILDQQSSPVAASTITEQLQESGLYYEVQNQQLWGSALTTLCGLEQVQKTARHPNSPGRGKFNYQITEAGKTKLHGPARNPNTNSTTLTIKGLDVSPLKSTAKAIKKLEGDMTKATTKKPAAKKAATNPLAGFIPLEPAPINKGINISWSKDHNLRIVIYQNIMKDFDLNKDQKVELKINPKTKQLALVKDPQGSTLHMAKSGKSVEIKLGKTKAHELHKLMKGKAKLIKQPEINDQYILLNVA